MIEWLGRQDSGQVFGVFVVLVFVVLAIGAAIDCILQERRRPK